MAIVTAQMTVSLDGFFSGLQHVDAGFHRVTRWVIDAFAWRERLGYEGGEHNTSSELITEAFEATGAYVMGGPLDHDAVALTPVRVVDLPDATHVRYTVEGPATLSLDDRSAGSTVRTNDR
jgi:hypothetical protein